MGPRIGDTGATCSRRWGSWVLASLALAACEGGDDAALVHGDHVDVHPSDEDRVCVGTLDDMESSIEAFTGFLGIELQQRITVYYGASAVEEHCPPGFGGCAWPVDGRAAVAAPPQAIDHELVHAVRYASGIRGRRFFEEGIAIYVSALFSSGVEFLGTPSAPDERGPLQLSALPSQDITFDDYGTAASFTMWMFETIGEGPSLAFFGDSRYADSTDVEAAFTEHLDRSIAQADAQWRAAENVASLGELCRGAIAVPWSPDGIVFESALDCDEHDTLGPVNGALSHRRLCVEIPAAVALDITLEGAAGEVYLRGDNCAPNQGLEAEAYQDKHIDAATPERHEFAACTWVVVLTGEPDGRGGPITLRMTP